MLGAKLRGLRGPHQFAILITKKAKMRYVASSLVHWSCPMHGTSVGKPWIWSKKTLHDDNDFVMLKKSQVMQKCIDQSGAAVWPAAQRYDWWGFLRVKNRV